MDNEEKNISQENEGQESRQSENTGGAHYRKVVNVYSSDGNAFDRHDSRPYPRNYDRAGGHAGGYGRGGRPGGYSSDNQYRGGGYQGGERGGYYGRGYNRDAGYRGQAGPRQGYSRYGQGGDRQDYAPRERYGGYAGGGAGYGRRDDSRAMGGEQQSGRYDYQPRRQYGGRGYGYGSTGRPSGGGYGAGGRGGYRRGDYDPAAKYSMRKRIQYAEDNIDPDAPIRLNKFLANAGVCSRRDADKYIETGVVTVNGEVITQLGTKIKRDDVVRFNNEPVTIEKKVYVLLNKPKDYVTTSEDPQNRKTVMDLVANACRERIYPVGRLDRNTTGVLLLTNDGELASKLTHPKYKKKKIYHVHLDHSVTAADMQQIANGIQLDDGEVHADAIEYASPTDKKQVGIEIHSGKNRIVRRIFESLGYHVTKLDRVYFAGLTKKNLKRGQWRFLSQEEVNYLKMGEFE